MAEPPALNASPIIVLSRAGHLHLARAVYPRCVVPEAVAGEILRGPPGDPALGALQAESWLERVTVASIPASVAAWDLGPGEAEVLAWALAHPGCEAILDDALARRGARALGIAARGTIGVVLLARRRDLIPAARPVLGSLRDAGLFISPELLRSALSLVGE